MPLEKNWNRGRNFYLFTWFCNAYKAFAGVIIHSSQQPYRISIVYLIFTAEADRHQKMCSSSVFKTVEPRFMRDQLEQISLTLKSTGHSSHENSLYQMTSRTFNFMKTKKFKFSLNLSYSKYVNRVYNICALKLLKHWKQFCMVIWPPNI